MAKTKVKTPIETLKEICPLFTAVGVTRVVASYDGSGDSGDFQEICFWFCDPVAENDQDAMDTATNGRRMYLSDFKRLHVEPSGPNPTPIISPEKLEEFTETLWHLLPGGWEINEGSFGEIEIDTLKCKIKQQHNERIMETNTTENEW
ncbi:hypothetical protein EBZ39_01685 [bacterium]|nr:hypothetical protein [bacterium]